MKFKKTKLTIIFSALLATNTFAITTIPSFMMNSGEGPRLATVVKGQPFYKSTGLNSHNSNTMFPFLSVSANLIEKPGLDGSTNGVIKTVKNKFIKKLKPEYQFQFIQHLNKIGNIYIPCQQTTEPKWECAISVDSNLRNLFSRFDSLDNAVISYNFGGGFWENNQSSEGGNLTYKALSYAVQKSGGVLNSYNISNTPTEVFKIEQEHDKINTYLSILGALTLPETFYNL